MEPEQMELEKLVLNFKKDFIDLIEKHVEFLSAQELFFVIFSKATEGALFCAPDRNEAFKVMDQAISQGILDFQEKKGLKC